MGDLYRSPTQESDVRRWCEGRLASWNTPHTRSLLPTSLGETHLTSLGEGADVCVYLPGTNFNAATSTRILAVLAERCRVLCADLPGQPGLSAAGRPRDETAAYARWVTEVLQEARRAAGSAGRLVLMGHSRGAAVALTADPSDVDALVLLSPAGLSRVHLTPTLLARSVSWLLRPTRRRSAQVVGLMAGTPAGAELDGLVDWMTLVARSTRTTGAPGPLPADVLGRWREYDVHVLVGELDVFFPPRRLAGPVRRHLDQHVVVVEGAGHLLVDQRPDVVGTALTGVLGGEKSG